MPFTDIAPVIDAPLPPAPAGWRWEEDFFIPDLSHEEFNDTNLSEEDGKWFWE